MADVVHHHSKTFQSPDAKQGHVARLGKDDFIVGFVAFGAEDGVADLPLDFLLSGRGEYPLTARGNAGASQNVRRQPGQFGAGIHERLQGLGGHFLALGTAGNDIDFENAYG